MLFVDGGNDKVGIGTSSPATHLQIEGASGGEFGLHRTTGTTTGLLGSITAGNKDIDSGMGGIDFTQDGETDSSRIGLFTQATGGAKAEAMRINQSGNVGIGTLSNTTYPLHIKKDTDNFTVKIENDGNSTSSDGLWVDTRWNTATNTLFKVTSNSGTLDVLNVMGDGKVGIGIDSPDQALHVHGVGTVLSSDSYFVATIQTDRNDDGSNDDGILQFVNGSAKTVKGEIRWDESSNTFELGHGDNQGHIVIESGGNVGIGETNPSEKLHVDGMISCNKRVTAKIQDIFHVGGEDWCDHGRYAFSAATHVSSTSPYYSGAQITGHTQYTPDVFIPYSIGTVMKLAVSIYCVTNDSTYGDTRYYAGCIGYDKDFNFMNVDGIGTYQYNMMSNLAFSAGARRERDVTIKGWQGSGATDGNKMDEGTVYIRPMLLCNYQRQTATTVIEGFTIMPAGTVADNDSNAGTNF
jgi:hypothetical protein